MKLPISSHPSISSRPRAISKYQELRALRSSCPSTSEKDDNEKIVPSVSSPSFTLSCASDSEHDDENEASYDAFSASSFLSSDSDSDDLPENLQFVFDSCYLVYDSNLMKLFQRCSSCGCPIEQEYIERRVVGSCLQVKTICPQGHELSWESQPRLPNTRVYVGNIALPTATILTGNTYQTLNEIAETINIPIPSRTLFYEAQRQWISPIIMKCYKAHQEDVTKEVISNGPAILVGDGRYLESKMESIISDLCFRYL